MGSKTDFANCHFQTIRNMPASVVVVFVFEISSLLGNKGVAVKGTRMGETTDPHELPLDTPLPPEHPPFSLSNLMSTGKVGTTSTEATKVQRSEGAGLRPNNRLGMTGPRLGLKALRSQSRSPSRKAHQRLLW